MDSAAAEIWTLAANDVEDESKDPIDADELLDPEDLDKPLSNWDFFFFIKPENNEQDEWHRVHGDLSTL